MVDDAPSYESVRQRLRQTLGEPESMPGGGRGRDRWTIRPVSRFDPPIHVLVDSCNGYASVWVFDPHKPEDIAEQIDIKDEPTLDRAIRRFQRHLARGVESDGHEMVTLPSSARGFLECLLNDCRRAAGDEVQQLAHEVERALSGLPRSTGAIRA